MSIVKLDLLNHADFHGKFKEDEDTPGLSRFYCAIESVRKQNPEGTLLLDAGDNTNKVLWSAEKVFDGLKLIGTDAFVLGNHEFDKGQAVLEKNIEYASKYFPVLCSNIYEKATQQRIKGTKPYCILERMGIKIGIIGCTTEYTPKMVEASAFEPYQAKSAVEEIRLHTQELRKQGVEVLVILSHFPFYFEPEESGELFDVLHQVEDLGIDAMIGGHIPGDYGKVYHNIAVTKGGFGGESLPCISLYFDTELRKVVHKECRVINVMEMHEQDERILQFQNEVIAPYRTYYEEALGEALETIPMRLAYESPMGNLIADAVRSKAKTDLAYFNSTSCGHKIEKGKITRFSIHKAIAFNETIHVGKISGQCIYDLFECVLSPERFGNNANIIFSGIRVEIDNTKEKNKVVSICLENGDAIQKEHFYTVCTSKYMSSGGNDTRSISSQIAWEDTGVHIHDAIADYILEKKELDAKVDGRYCMHGEIQNDNSPW